ncbi:trimethylamine methyltransferase family protein [Desulforapulum autotrophicum]|uniref:trimethylamine methyltransferase family protein n=1 Tax=Desulforapulum autotrophicum TaxID=2296 RepID=UPI001E49FAFC|nr:trimethylamine methyltransferase family protein [Desulforapulum autotrophicum]
MKVIDQNEIELIHQMSLQLLDTIGVFIEDDAVLSLLADHGCRVNMKKKIAKLPSELIEKALNTCPSEFTLKSANGKNDLLFEPKRVHFGPCSGMEIMDIKTGKLRPGTVADAEKTLRLTDALDIMAGANAGLGFISDCPVEINLVCYYALCLRNSAKIFALGAMEDSVKWGIEIGRLTGQDVLIQASSSSPLSWHSEQIDAIKLACQAGLPVILQSMASPGTSAPVTLSSTIALMNAEILSMLVVTQLLRPGTGVMYSCFTLPMDMRYGTLASGSIELGMLTVASAQLARYYGIHSMIYGPNTDSKIYDPQSGFEKALQGQLEALAGINLIWGAGMIQNHTIWSDAQLMLDCEVFQMIGRSIEGITVRKETMELELFQQVGHFPNNFLSHPHTLKHCRTELLTPPLISRESRDAWMAKGSKGIMEKAEAQAEKILKNHEPRSLTPEIHRELDKIVKAAAKEKGIDIISL